MTKTCTKCGKELEATTENFARCKKGRLGFRATCKTCDSEYRKAHYRKNRQQIREKQNQYFKDYYDKNKDRILEQKKVYYRENKDERAEYSRQYAKRNSEKIKAYKRQYKRDNKELFRIHKQKRKAKKDKLPATLTAQQWEATKKAFDYRCAYCGMFEERHLQEFGESLHQDHFVPLSKGGGYTPENIVPACRRCNSSKRDGLFEEWYPNYEFYDRKREIRILTFLRKQQALDV